MKRAIAIVLASTVLLTAGCASVQKKFTRKKKVPKHVSAVMAIEEGPYQKKFSNDYYYRTHYTLWKTWHDELLNAFGGNRKKVERCAQEAYNHLDSLHRLLVPEKAVEMDDDLAAMKKIVLRIEAGGYSESEEPGVRNELEKLKRLIQNDFYYDKVKASVVPDKVDLGA